MRKILCFLSIIGFVSAKAQDMDYTKPATLLVNFSLTDFKSAKNIRTSSLASVINNNTFSSPAEMNAGFGLTYLKGLSNHIDFMSTLNGCFVDYPWRNKAAYGSDNLLLSLDATTNIKLLTDKNTVVPYVNLGVGAFKASSTFGAYIPVGVGLQINLFDEAYLMTNASYHIPVTAEANYHLFFNIGMGGPIAEKKKMEMKPTPAVPVEMVAPPVEAKAPEVPKDTDGDGIPDASDKCPTIPGVAKYQGCPVPDTDKDGINDDDDKCPNVPGLARYQGCPIPDTDGDGVNDELDKCPNEAGPASNNGCPVKQEIMPPTPATVAPEAKAEITKKVNLAAQKIFFETSKSSFLPQSFTAMNNIVKIMKQNPTVKLDISGHTDNAGVAAKNLILSQSRADAVEKYLISKGIAKDRLTAKGYGQTMPVASNATAAGKAKNRRVELKISE